MKGTRTHTEHEQFDRPPLSDQLLMLYVDRGVRIVVYETELNTN